MHPLNLLKSKVGQTYRAPRGSGKRRLILLTSGAPFGHKAKVYKANPPQTIPSAKKAWPVVIMQSSQLKEDQRSTPNL